jgi:hypothetical protein
MCHGSKEGHRVSRNLKSPGQGPGYPEDIGIMQARLMKGPIRSLWYTNEELQRAESRVLVEMGGLRNSDTSWCAATIEVPRIANSGPPELRNSPSCGILL